MSLAEEDASPRSERLKSLLARVSLGDRAAFAALYQETSAQLLAVILRIHRQRDQAEEVLQEVFVNVWRSAQSFEAARSQPMTWLTSVARHRAIDSLRRERTQPRTVSINLGSQDDDESEDLLTHLPSDDPGPLAHLLRVSQARALGDCVARLSADQQQCLALAFYRGLSHGEVAEHLVQPLGTVKSWLRRAMQSLKTCLSRAAGADAVAVD